MYKSTQHGLRPANSLGKRCTGQHEQCCQQCCSAMTNNVVSTLISHHCSLLSHLLTSWSICMSTMVNMVVLSIQNSPVRSNSRDGQPCYCIIGEQYCWLLKQGWTIYCWFNNNIFGPTMLLLAHDNNVVQAFSRQQPSILIRSKSNPSSLVWGETHSMWVIQPS